MRVLVCGSRLYNDWREVFDTLSIIHMNTPISLIIHGMAKGADSIGEAWAHYHSIPRSRYDADWKTHGKAAGPIRNQLMLDDGKPDLVVAFPLKTSKGTRDMIRKAKDAGVEVVIIEP